MIFRLAVLITEYNQQKQKERDPERLTITKLSEETGIARSTLTRFHKGEVTRVDIATIKSLCDFFNCPIQELMRFEGDA